MLSNTKTMELTICKKICKECPFSVNSLQGYIDYHSTDEITWQINNEIPFSCHLQRTEDVDTNHHELMSGKQNVCRGFVATSKKSAKLFGGNPIYGQQLLKLQKTITNEDLEKVFTKWDFVKYHSKKII